MTTKFKQTTAGATRETPPQTAPELLAKLASICKSLDTIALALNGASTASLERIAATLQKIEDRALLKRAQKIKPESAITPKELFAKVEKFKAQNPGTEPHNQIILFHHAEKKEYLDYAQLRYSSGVLIIDLVDDRRIY